MKKNLLLVVCAFLICASSTSVSALNAKRVGRGAWYTVLTGTSAYGLFCITFSMLHELRRRDYKKAAQCFGFLIPVCFGVHGGIKGLAAVISGDEYKNEVDVDTV